MTVKDTRTKDQEHTEGKKIIFRRTIQFGRDDARVRCNSEMQLRDQTGKMSRALRATTTRKDASYGLARTKMPCQDAHQVLQCGGIEENV